MDSSKREQAWAVAFKAHLGQKDKAGVEYTFHILRVANKAYDLAPVELKDRAWVVGILHDTVEDTAVTLDEIESQFGYEIATAVKALTHVHGEPWDDYILRVSCIDLAIYVKLADLRHNSDFDRMVQLRRMDSSFYPRMIKVLMPRYIRATVFLEDLLRG